MKKNKSSIIPEWLVGVATVLFIAGVVFWTILSALLKVNTKYEE